jgi:3-oxoadipate CoA-transferase beta subunit
VLSTRPLTRTAIAWRAAQDFDDGMYINLGVGIPTGVSPDFIPTGREVIFHSENGVLGVGALAPPDGGSRDLVNASQQRVTVLRGACYFHCGDSFTMLRGGHIDLALVGAFQVSEHGDLASWSIDRPDVPPAVGGAMDIAVGAKRIWVLMEHCTRGGEARLVTRCSYPLTAPGVVSRIYTDLAVIDVVAGQFVVRESLLELAFDQLQAKTGAPLHRADDWRPLVGPAERGC